MGMMGGQQEKIRREGAREGMVPRHQDVGGPRQVGHRRRMAQALQMVGLVVIIGQIVEHIARIWQGLVVRVPAGSVGGGIVGQIWPRGHKHAETAGCR
jgi:hypothetical protein